MQFYIQDNIINVIKSAHYQLRCINTYYNEVMLEVILDII